MHFPPSVYPQQFKQMYSKYYKKVRMAKSKNIISESNNAGLIIEIPYGKRSSFFNTTVQ